MKMGSTLLGVFVERSSHSFIFRMPCAPLVHRVQDRLKSFSERSKRIFHYRWGLGNTGPGIKIRAI